MSEKLEADKRQSYIALCAMLGLKQTKFDGNSANKGGQYAFDGIKATLDTMISLYWSAVGRPSKCRIVLH